MWLGRSRNRSRQEEKAQLEKQVKQGGYGVYLFGEYSGVRSSVQNNRGINTDQDTEDLEPATFFRGRMCCSVDGVGECARVN